MKRRLPDPSDPEVKRAHVLFAELVARGEVTEDHIVWRYAVALWRFEHGEPEIVQSLLAVTAYGLPCPPGLQSVMADIATGRRKPGRKLGKCTAMEGMKAAFDLSEVLDAEDKVRANAAAESDASRGAALVNAQVARIASGSGTVVRFKGASDPADIIADSLQRVAAAKERIASGANISTTTLEKLERDLRAFLLRGGV